MQSLFLRLHHHMLKHRPFPFHLLSTQWLAMILQIQWATGTWWLISWSPLHLWWLLCHLLWLSHQSIQPLLQLLLSILLHWACSDHMALHCFNLSHHPPHPHLSLLARLLQLIYSSSTETEFVMHFLSLFRYSPWLHICSVPFFYNFFKIIFVCFFSFFNYSLYLKVSPLNVMAVRRY